MRGPLACALVVAGCLQKPPPPAQGTSDDAHVADGQGPSGDVGQSDGMGTAHNVMFVTSHVFGPPWVSNEADQFCGSVAGQAHLLGNYVAWLSFATGVSAATRLRSLPYAQDWYRTDGRLFAATVDDIITGALASPPRIDENNHDAYAADPTMQVATGTTAHGETEAGPDATCTNGKIEIGSPADTTSRWTEAGYSDCSAMALRLYCFSFGAHP